MSNCPFYRGNTKRMMWCPKLEIIVRTRFIRAALKNIEEMAPCFVIRGTELPPGHIFHNCWFVNLLKKKNLACGWFQMRPWDNTRVHRFVLKLHCAPFSLKMNHISRIYFCHLFSSKIDILAATTMGEKETIMWMYIYCRRLGGDIMKHKNPLYSYDTCPLCHLSSSLC